MQQEMSYYRVSTEFYQEDLNGALIKQKTEDLVRCSCYTDAEQTALALANYYNRDKFAESSFLKIKVVKTPINCFLYNDLLVSESQLINKLVCCGFEETRDSSVGIYAVKVMYIDDEDEKRKKTFNEVIYVPAIDVNDAMFRVTNYIDESQETKKFFIREVKFDKAESILWDPQFYKSKISECI